MSCLFKECYPNFSLAFLSLSNSGSTQKKWSFKITIFTFSGFEPKWISTLRKIQNSYFPNDKLKNRPLWYLVVHTNTFLHHQGTILCVIVAHLSSCGLLCTAQWGERFSEGVHNLIFKLLCFNENFFKFRTIRVHKDLSENIFWNYWRRDNKNDFSEFISTHCALSNSLHSSTIIDC